MTPLTMIQIRPTMRLHWEWICPRCGRNNWTFYRLCYCGTPIDRWLIGTLDTKGTTQ